MNCVLRIGAWIEWGRWANGGSRSIGRAKPRKCFTREWRSLAPLLTAVQARGNSVIAPAGATEHKHLSAGSRRGCRRREGALAKRVLEPDRHAVSGRVQR